MKSATAAAQPCLVEEGGSLRRLLLLIPVYNDWRSLQQLLAQIDEAVATARGLLAQVGVLIIDDGSTEPPPTFDPESQRHLDEVHLLQLNGNVGHQRAIALGLAWSMRNLEYDAVVVMDGDGEDTPADAMRLVEKSQTLPDTSIIAERAKRSEGLLFRLGYRAFRLVHRIATGKEMRFGNFCLLRRNHVRRLIASPAIWNHFAAGIIQARLPLAHIAVDRGRRLAGKSHMNYVSLVVHGLSAIAVQLETAAVRLLLATLGLFGVTIMGIGAVVAVRLFTERAIPGWASTLILLLAVVALQSIFISAFLAFTILHTRTQRLFVPAVDFEVFLQQVRRLGHGR